ncbi:FAD-dependent oxidoreductase [Candidatus Anaplasma sp. TIGMIC]|uniref:FAD-dependent oxidoreductase n=1 Tax=Candidatus Anaplasma sp. TIGMIC TaxID=3020713 RepID=UPI00232AC1C8|nr:FAD-dependent oxidoreductase [Candidatus Anaplasma sp. TIGMIC]MDB1135219.1 FAD-dependent oxidoreductase [Candidatus Anaplasma sp. TIGMIC]
MVKTAGIAGAGLAGRILALCLLRERWDVTIFDQDDTSGKRSCGYAAGGMLSLYSEAESIGDLVVELGHRSMELWPELLRYIDASDCLQTNGSIIVAHTVDLPDLERRCEIIRKRFPDMFGELYVTNNICELESGLSAPYGMYIKGEGSIDNVALFGKLEHALMAHGVTWYSNANVARVSSGEIVAEGISRTFDVVFDCRGIGAKCDIPYLRGVRGESIVVYAPGASFKRAIRVTHPRYSIYVVPRKGNLFLVGASEIESCDFSEVSVQSALEMLSALYSLHKGFAEARILDMLSACRPAFRDNLPRVLFGNKIVRINGLYRYGYLSIPAIVEEVVSLLKGGNPRYESLHAYA